MEIDWKCTGNVSLISFSVIYQRFVIVKFTFGTMLKIHSLCLFLTVSLLVLLLFFNSSVNKIIMDDTNNEMWSSLLLRDGNNQTILNKTVQDLWEQSLRLWDYQNEVLAFIHVVKSGGTSFEQTLSMRRHKDGCRVKCVGRHITILGNRVCPTYLYSLCGHLDWTTIIETENLGIQFKELFLISMWHKEGRKQRITGWVTKHSVSLYKIWIHWWKVDRFGLMDRLVQSNK